MSKANGTVRSVDIAALLNVSKSTVHKATHTLKNLNFIEQEYYGDIRLTPSGRECAEIVLKTHSIIKDFLIEVLGVDPITAEIDACKMEHNISPETLTKIKEFKKVIK